MEAKSRLIYLLNRFNKGTATSDELTELERLLDDPKATSLLKELWQEIPSNAHFFEEDKSETMLATIIQRNRMVQKMAPKGKRNMQALLAAAAIVLVAAGAWFFASVKPTKNVRPVADISKPRTPVVHGGDKAVLVLSDGSTVTLDNSVNGAIAKQGATNVSKTDGQVIYALNDTLKEVTTNIIYNTLKIPRGGQYQLVLADGTKVWMNASSSLHFPTAFPGNERIVELTGEAYFEVAKDARRTFSVKVKGITVNVLGTHFNVMAYENETATAVTLLEGVVNVSKENDKVTLRPGQQALFTPGADLNVVNKVNLEETIAWKNGYFQLDHTDLAVLMRQIERWYNIDVVYQGKIPNRQFGGKISRKSDINHVIKILEASKVFCRIEGNKIIVLDK